MTVQEYIFVFGSNEAGRHGKGAAKCAAEQFGAVQGVGEGITGRAYGIPTKDRHIRVRSLPDISLSVKRFLQYAAENLQERFKVTRIGCGLAGYANEDIAPMFAGAPKNCGFDPDWAAFGLQTWNQIGIEG